jgi:hypothetical protein
MQPRGLKPVLIGTLYAALKAPLFHVTAGQQIARGGNSKAPPFDFAQGRLSRKVHEKWGTRGRVRSRAAEYAVEADRGAGAKRDHGG